MAKSISHAALDAAFAYIAERGDTLVLCAGAPESAEEALTPAGEGGRMLGRAAMVPGLGNGDFSLAPGVTSGRRLVVRGRERVAVVASGCADHLALVAAATGEVLVVTELAEPCEMHEGGTVTVRGFSDEIADPV
jgi:hypothetical protein